MLSNGVFAKACHEKCQLTQIKAYFSALDKVSRSGSTVKDIDSLLALTHQDVKYIHVEYEADFNKEDWRKAFMRNLKRGAYRKSKKNEMRVINHIAGKNYMAVEYSHGMIPKNGHWQATKPLLVIFGFTEQKISLIKELW
jgi:hypothetical protein